MKNPKNVEAVRDWLAKNTSEAHVAIFDRILRQDRDNVGVATAMLGLALQGFEAGREFERANPDVVSGIGYVND